MLKQRILTALVLAPLMLGGIFFLEPEWFAAFIGFIIFLGAWEWARLAGFSKPLQRIGYGIVISAILGSLYLFSNGDINDGLLFLALVWWSSAFFLVKRYPHKRDLWLSRIMRLVMGGLILIPTWVGLVHLKSYESANWLILYVFGIVWAADIGAYFSGRAFGKHKLAPDVSPGKTWEGVLGGVVSTLILAVATIYLINDAQAVDLTFLQCAMLILVTAGITLISVLGDLMESMIKRFVGMKDSSRLLPGHGGVMDRIDSLTAAVPVFALAVSVSGWSIF